jgi:hypothetical protein
MNTYNTGNPLGSAAAKDLFDNAQNLDEAVNGLNKTWIDRIGRSRRSMAGIDYDANQAMLKYGYITKKSFELGATLDTPNTVLKWESDGEFYRWDGDWSTPKVVPAGSTPDSTGGIGENKWVGVGDAALRGQLSDPDGVSKYPEIQMSRWRDEGDVRGWGADASGQQDSTLAFIAAAAEVGEGGVLLARAGNYLLKTITLSPVSILGDGQGKTILTFDNSSGQNDGVVFSNMTKTDVEFGLRDLSICTVNGHGGNAIYTPRGTGLNALRAKPTFQRLSFFSQNTGDSIEGFSQVYSWTWIFNLGDSWQGTIDDIDAVGSYMAKTNHTSQFLDGFIRTAPEEGILSLRVHDITTHNVANFFEIKQKTYFTLLNVDVARALRGIYDAPDRVFETNRYAYGECICTNIGINAQLEPIKLDNRFLLIVNGMFIHRAADGYDHGNDWIGIKLTRPRVCTLQGLEIGTASGYSGKKIGIYVDAGDANNFSNVSFGLLDVGAQIGVTGSTYGANQATNFNNVSINANTTTVFDLQAVRNFHCNGYANSSNYSYSTFATFGSDTSNTYSFSNVDKFNEWTNDSIYWRNGSLGSDLKNTRISLASGVTIASQTDAGAAGNNVFIARRTATTTWDSVEVRTKTTTGGFILLTTPETQCSGLIKPTVDNANTNGTAAFRWSQIYAGSGSINTSNEELKTRVEADDATRAAEKAAALEIKSDIWRFKFNDAAKRKGDNARVHFGVGAQSVGNILTKHGLDPNLYAFWCYDEWEDIYQPEVQMRTVTDSDSGQSWEEEYLTGNQVIVKPAGYQYGIRYDELLMFIMAAI